ncbi:uncharacterized protein SAMN02800694_2070 [Luteibacter sp. UNCMF331Sha3.1]|uniref:DUF418 domain-containing protein n=1 Tax=Luteibacter sp. UNCMF331Sha3.1 TaxID=1502760 RepID=UPI0008B6C3EE|nr:DUF418 domain-containing protein [Luteibacter sp. UNCMF331Sha3.1]SEM89903.1 uncharacterized protein SAMN02800694_2070 [Luteibacter sp. UNCMF331Sha3.1]
MTNRPDPLSARIALIDVLRGVAILGIFFMNIPFMGNSIFWWPDHPELLGDAGADLRVFGWLALFVDGTQRGMFQLLLGASIVLLTSKGQRAPEWLYHRRYVLLFASGLIDVFVVGWDGDILHPYALVAMAVYPLRSVSPRWLLLLGTALLAAGALLGLARYDERARLQSIVAEARVSLAPTTPEKIAMAQWSELESAAMLPPELLTAERDAHAAGAIATWHWYRNAWFQLQATGFSLDYIKETLALVLIGMALFRWAVLQGGRSRRFYVAMLIAGYAFGLTTRLLDGELVTGASPIPRMAWVLGDIARLAITLGHIALLNLIWRFARAQRVMRVFEAAGRMAFSLYFAEAIIGNWLLFSNIGLDLWGRYGWAALSLIALGVCGCLLIAANLWMRAFLMGPLEWVWRSLTYGRRMPMRRSGAGVMRA